MEVKLGKIKKSFVERFLQFKANKTIPAFIVRPHQINVIEIYIFRHKCWFTSNVVNKFKLKKYRIVELQLYLI